MIGIGYTTDIMKIAPYILVIAAALGNDKDETGGRHIGWNTIPELPPPVDIPMCVTSGSGV